MNWLRRFMAGRYGGDQLSMVLIGLALVISIVGQVTNLMLLTLVSYIPLLWSIYRILSRNITKRSMENYKFSIWISPLYAWGQRRKSHWAQAKTHRFFTCPNCKAKLKVPKGRGKIKITCPKCKTEFIKKT